MNREQRIRDAFHGAHTRRPYQPDAALVAAVTPPGGEWRVEVHEGAITRSVMWCGTEVALVNPRGNLNDMVEGDIAMALRAAPLMDAALRCILVLAEDASNLPLIRDIAIASVAFIEMPAPPVPEPDEDDPCGDEDEDEEDRPALTGPDFNAASPPDDDIAF